MTNKELQELLKQYPDDCKINIHVDAETSELQLKNAWVYYVAEDRIILLTMSVCNPK